MYIAHRIATHFDLTNGQTLTCQYYKVQDVGCDGSGAGWDPEDVTYYLDDEEVSITQLPKGLDHIARELLGADPGEYGYRSTLLTYHY